MINIVGCKTPVKPMYFELDIVDPPPILMLAINPHDFTKTFTKKVADGRVRPSNRDTAPYVRHFDYDELDVLSCSGTSATFYHNKGLEHINRTKTLGYRNLKSLVEIYRNNGRNYNSSRFNAPLITGGSGLIKSVGRVIIAYDDMIYRGAFDSFTINEIDAKPFNLEFSFQFTVSKTLDVRNP